jgi:tetratricopeptide (TPR) repeat protein
MDPRFVSVVREIDPDVTCDELADIVWLATHLPSRRRPAGQDGPPIPPSPARPPWPDVEPQAAPQATDTPETEEMPSAGSLTGEDTAALRLPPSRIGDGPSGVNTRSPAVPAISSELDILRSLLPLGRRVPSQSQNQPDEEATANWVAETGLWFPRVRPVSERWLDIALVVDDSASMAIWQRTLVELRTLLERTGAFRDVRVWHMDGDLRYGETLSIAGVATELKGRRGPAELVDPTGQRLVIVMTDCVGRAWSTQSTGDALAVWAAAGPTVILQMLPQRMWAGCAPEFHSVRLRGIEPGLPNARLMVESRVGDDELGSYGLPVPVLELESRWLKPWAALVSGAAGSWVNSCVVFTDLMLKPYDPDALPGPALAAPEEHLRHFRAQVSPTAYRLAVYLSAGAPLSLQVMRLVQGAMLPSSRPSHLAEVFLSGILKRIGETDGSNNSSQDDVEYDFLPGIRDMLISELPRQDALQVLANVSNFVSYRLGSPVDFRALLTMAKQTDSPTLSPPFAEVAVKVLSALGGRYAEAADRLARLASLRRPTGAASTLIQGVRDNDHLTADRPGDKVTSVSSEATTSREREQAVLPQIMRGVPSRNPRFTGRVDLINKLHHMLVTGTERAALLPHTLHGLGGVGKTQLAIEYVYKFAHEYDLICWLPAHDLTQVRSSLVELGNAMELPENSNVTRAVTAVLDALSTRAVYRRWLLVFDNADNPEDLQPYLPYPTGHVLVTSRNADWSELAKPFVIDVFTRPESIDCLRQRVPTISDEDANKLAERLGDLPLALDTAGAWQAATGMPVSEYLRLFEDQFLRLTEFPPPGDYPTPVGATYALTLDRLREQAPGAAQLLDVCAFFGPEPISVNLLWDGRQADLPAPLAETLRDEIQLRRALQDIGRYALARVDPVNDQLTVHRLVQVVLRSRLDDAERRQTQLAAQRILFSANPGAPDRMSNWPRHAELSPHILAAELLDVEDDRVRTVVLDQIRYRWVRGDYEGSMDLGRRTVERWRELWGDDDVLTLIARRHLAVALRTLGFYREARGHAEQTLTKFRELLGDDHQHTLVTADAVSWDRRTSGKYQEARELDEDNLTRLRRGLGDEHPMTLKATNNFAIDLRWLGDFGRAREVDEDSVRLRRLVYGEEDRNTQLAIASLARDHYGLGHYARGLEMQERALTIQRRLFEPDNAEVLAETRNLVVLLRKTGQHARARDVANELVQTYEQRFGDNDEPTLAANMSYVNALRTAGQLEEALRLGQDVLNRYRHAFGDEHPAALACASNLAIVLRHRGSAAEALELNERALAAFRRRLGEDHPFTLACATNTANDLAALHRHGDARQLSEDTLLRSRRVRGDDHPDTLACALNVALDRRANGDEAGVEPLLSETVAAFKRRLGENHPVTVDAMASRRADCDIEPPET